MRILRVIATTDPASGGPIEGLIQSSAVMATMGHVNEVVSLDPPDAEWLSSFSLKIHAQGPSSRPYGYTPRLTPWLKKHSPFYDAIIVHGVWNYASVGAWRAMSGGGTPYVVFTHGMLDPWFRKHRPFKHLAKQAFWLMLEGRVLKDAKAVLFTSEEERQLARKSFFGHQYIERVVAYGTAGPSGDEAAQIGAFRAQVPELRNQKFLLFLSRIHPKKGCDLLVQAFAMLASEHPAIDLVIAGPDQIGWSAELKELASKLGVANRIHWPGMLSGNSKWGAFRSAEALILPSHQENFGIVVAEAMACSTPVLITNKVNIWREVQRSGGGFVEADDINGVVRLLRRFLSISDEERHVMGKSAMTGFLKYFDMKSAAHDLCKVLEEVGAQSRHLS